VKTYFALLILTGVLFSLFTTALPPTPRLPARAYRQYGAVGQVGRLAFGIRIEVGVRRL
jgi:hypothetical protein